MFKLHNGYRDMHKCKDHVVFAMCDDAGKVAIGGNVYGRTFVLSSPSTSFFARNGVVNDNAHAAGTMCATSRMAIMFSRPSEDVGIIANPGGRTGNTYNGINQFPLMPGAPQHLKDMGYDEVYLVGKTHLYIEASDGVPDFQSMIDDIGFDGIYGWAGPAGEKSISFKNAHLLDPDMAIAHRDVMVGEIVSNLIQDATDRGVRIAVFMWFHAPHSPLLIDYDDPDATKFMHYSEGPHRSTAYAMHKIERAISKVRRAARISGCEILWNFTSDQGPASLWNPSYTNTVANTQKVGVGAKGTTGTFNICVPDIWNHSGDTSFFPAGFRNQAVTSGLDLIKTMYGLHGMIPPAEMQFGEDMTYTLRGFQKNRNYPLFWGSVSSNHMMTRDVDRVEALRMYDPTPRDGLPMGCYVSCDWDGSKASVNDLLDPNLRTNLIDDMETYDVDTMVGRLLNVAHSWPIK